MRVKTSLNAIPRTSTVFYKLWMRDYRNMDRTMMAQESPEAIGVL